MSMPTVFMASFGQEAPWGLHCDQAGDCTMTRLPGIECTIHADPC